MHSEPIHRNPRFRACLLVLLTATAGILHPAAGQSTSDPAFAVPRRTHGTVRFGTPSTGRYQGPGLIVTGHVASPPNNSTRPYAGMYGTADRWRQRGFHVSSGTASYQPTSMQRGGSRYNFGRGFRGRTNSALAPNLPATTPPYGMQFSTGGGSFYYGPRYATPVAPFVQPYGFLPAPPVRLPNVSPIAVASGSVWLLPPAWACDPCGMLLSPIAPLTSGCGWGTGLLPGYYSSSYAAFGVSGYDLFINQVSSSAAWNTGNRTPAHRWSEGPVISVREAPFAGVRVTESVFGAEDVNGVVSRKPSAVPLREEFIVSLPSKAPAGTADRVRSLRYQSTGDEYFRNKDYSSAAVFYQAAANAAPLRPAPWIRSAWAHVASGELPTAIEDLKRGLLAAGNTERDQTSVWVPATQLYGPDADALSKAHAEQLWNWVEASPLSADRLLLASLFQQFRGREPEAAELMAMAEEIGLPAAMKRNVRLISQTNSPPMDNTPALPPLHAEAARQTNSDLAGNTNLSAEDGIRMNGRRLLPAATADTAAETRPDTDNLNEEESTGSDEQLSATGTPPLNIPRQ